MAASPSYLSSLCNPLICRQDKAGMSQQCPRRRWVKTMSKESTYSTGKTGVLSQTGGKLLQLPCNKHLQSSGNQKGDVSAAQGPSSVCYSPKSYTKFGERNSLEGQRRRGKFFPKATFHVFSSNPFEFSLS